MAGNDNIKVPLACSHLTISYLLLITSIVTFVGSIAMKYQLSSLFGHYFNDYLEMPLIILIAGSVLVFADACLGLISLTQKWYLGVIMFLVSTICLLVAMIAFVALAYIHLHAEEETMFLLLEDDLRNHEISMEAIDAVQLSLKCCGYENFGDWTNRTGKNVPQSCCIQSLPCDTNDSSEIHSTGCYEAMSLFLECRKWLVVVVLAVLGLVKIVAITLSIIVCRRFPHRGETSETPATDNSTEVNNALPRIHNPLGQSSFPSIDKSRIYVRRPTQLPPVLNYRSPHENYLRQPPQLRFDRRVMLRSSKLKNPYAVRPGRND